MQQQILILTPFQSTIDIEQLLTVLKKACDN